MQSTKKSFLADVKPVLQDATLEEWVITLPDLQAEFFVKNLAALNEYESACSGALASNIKIEGICMHQKRNPN